MGPDRSESLPSTTAVRAEPFSSLDEVSPFEAELRALPDGRVLTPNVDVTYASLLIAGVSAKLARLRPALERRFGADAALLDRLWPLAQLLEQAQGWVVAVEASSDLDELTEALLQTRAILQSEIASLAHRKLLFSCRRFARAGTRAPAMVAFDVVGLATHLGGRWDTVGAHSGLTELDLDRAEALAAKVMRASCPVSAELHAAIDRRNRAYTLLFETYDEVRRMVAYLRWQQGDAEKLAPSWYRGGRPRRRRRSAKGAPRHHG